MRSPHRALGIAALALLLVGAASDDETADLVRQGNAAYARKDYEAAVRFFEKAEARAADPGLVAFNKGAALYRQGHFHEAELCYRRCLDDGEAPTPRRLRALYDLGTSLLHVQDGKDARALALAVRCLSECRRRATDADLRGRAGYNLELARLLLARAAADPANPGPSPKDDEEKQGNKDDDQRGQEGELSQQTGRAQPKGGALLKEPLKGQQKTIETKEMAPGKGNLGTLPDTDELTRLDPQDTAEHLERAARRIRGEQLQQRRSGERTLPNVKDW